MPRQQPSKHGAILGAAFARIADVQAPLHPEIPDRCRTCAFRHGTVPNQMAGTLVEALNCVIGTDPSLFCCHHDKDSEGNPTQVCRGYLLAKEAPFAEVRQALVEASAELNALRKDNPDA